MKKIIYILFTCGVCLLLMGAGSRQVPGPNRPPVAVAGMDRVVARHATVFFDASRSFDPDGDKLYYKWELLAAPQNIPPREFSGRLGMKTCRLRSDILGTYIVALTVYDGKAASQRDVIQIRVEDPPGNPSEEIPQKDLYIPEPIRLGKANLRPAQMSPSGKEPSRTAPASKRGSEPIFSALTTARREINSKRWRFFGSMRKGGMCSTPFKSRRIKAAKNKSATSENGSCR